mmetsp:Transcript_17942/g.55663  ORF Transcript_17942/g.55663 Transcript_17942/m.55663 type:complete len:278 (+) Transcript_17942:17-850(+)
MTLDLALRERVFTFRATPEVELLRGGEAGDDLQEEVEESALPRQSEVRPRRTRVKLLHDGASGDPALELAPKRPLGVVTRLQMRKRVDDRAQGGKRRVRRNKTFALSFAVHRSHNVDEAICPETYRTERPSERERADADVEVVQHAIAVDYDDARPHSRRPLVDRKRPDLRINTVVVARAREATVARHDGPAFRLRRNSNCAHHLEATVAITFRQLDLPQRVLDELVCTALMRPNRNRRPSRVLLVRRIALDDDRHVRSGQHEGNGQRRHARRTLDL